MMSENVTKNPTNVVVGFRYVYLCYLNISVWYSIFYIYHVVCSRYLNVCINPAVLDCLLNFNYQTYIGSDSNTADILLG